MNSEFLCQNFYLGGYYIIKPTLRAQCMNSNILPDSILTASRCICDFYPNVDILWSMSKKRKEDYRTSLGIDCTSFDKMERWIVEELEKNFDIPDVFNSYEGVIEFYHNFLYNQKDLRIIGVALPTIYRDEFLTEQDDLRYGIGKNLNLSLPIDTKGDFRGYEILGYEMGGFHSYICNHLEDDYYDKYKLKLNKHGFISSLDEAVVLADYTNQEIVGTEPVLWLPWAILEYPINNSQVLKNSN